MIGIMKAQYEAEIVGIIGHTVFTEIAKKCQTG
jgi:hypothetical protein